MYPLNDFVTHAHRIDIRGHDLDAKRVFVSEGFKGLAPPARTFEQCRTNGLGRAAIYVINNRPHWLANPRVRIFLLQTMPRDKAFGYRLLDWGREVHVINTRVTGTRIKNARLETGRRQLHKRMAFTNSNRLRHRYNFSDELSRRLAGERQRGFHLRVLRKVFGVWKIERAASRLEFVCPLLFSLQRVRDAVNVA